MTGPIHLQPTAELAPRVLLPGDPGRALMLAQHLLEKPLMFNHHRGLWGYTGRAADGELLSIQSTGMGGPSAAIVISELIALGAERLLRVGTCGALDPALALGELLIASDCLCADGTSRAIAGGETVAPGPELVRALAHAGDGLARAARVVSTDLFYDDSRREHDWLAAGAVAVEMETATLFALAVKLGVQAASLLLVTDLVLPDRARIEPDELLLGEQRLGDLAAAALARPDAGLW
jgi:DeoD family purine-nucleoside phosphorylase